MKKIIFTLLISFLYCIEISAQNFYTFSKSTAPYTELTDANSINNGIIWGGAYIAPIEAPFPIYVFGYSFDFLGFDDTDFTVINNALEFQSLLKPITADITDRNFTGIGASASPISYKVEGAVGNRILKLELKNAGLQIDKTTGNYSSVHFLNYQVWFYEADNSIEYRYGTNNITNNNLINNENFPLTTIETLLDNNIFIGVLNGATENPTYNETNDIDSPATAPLNGIPAANTVYKFTPNPLSVKDQIRVEFSLYPNPATNLLNITLKEDTDASYSVYDMLGKELLKGNVNSKNTSIDTHSLSTGTYLLRIGSNIQKFQKK